MSDASNSSVQTFDPASDANNMVLNFTKAAALKVKGLVEGEENLELKLRIYITGGGCSGFQYGFTFDEQNQEGDTIIEREGARLVVDYLSLQYLQGATVDYEEGVSGAHFVISNPNAKTTCGCGSSFSV